MTVEQLANLAGLLRMPFEDGDTHNKWYGMNYSTVTDEHVVKYILDSPILMRNVITKLLNE